MEDSGFSAYDSSADSQLKTLERLRGEVEADTQVFKELYKRAKLDTRVLFTDEPEKFGEIYAVRDSEQEGRIAAINKYANQL